MKFTPTIGSNYSGSFGGCTASHNRYGSYIRQRVRPINPNSVQQQAIRSGFAECATAWNTELDQSERDAWDAYGLNVPGSGGQLVLGINWFIATNTPRRQANIDRLDTAPILFNGTALSPIYLTADVSSGLSIAYNAADEWCANDDGLLFIYQARGVNESRFFHKGPFRYDSFVLGDTGTPPASPYVIAAPTFPLVVGQKTFIRALAMAPDGRMSFPQIVSSIAVA